MVLLAAMAACGDDGSSSSGTSSSTVASTTISDAATTSNPVSTSNSVPTSNPVSTSAAPSTTIAPPVQRAIWPAADVVFTTPTAAAEDFVRRVIGVEPVLGEFQAGDSRSGEIEVVFRGESGNATPIVRSRLLMRQLGASNGWFVLAAVNDFVSIDSPDSSATVPAGPLVVSGVGRGFEATLNITTFVAGSVDRSFGAAIAMGGAYEKPEPFSATVDLSGAAPGDVVTIVVRGATGLETDPGEFAALSVLIRN
jgi:hypothetical protein